MTPEQKARQQIDAMLVASGWVERGGGVGVGGDRQPATGAPFAAIHPAESIHRKAGMKPPFIILPSSFCLGVPSILQKAFTGELNSQK